MKEQDLRGAAQQGIEKAMSLGSFHTFQINRAAELAISAICVQLRDENKDIFEGREKLLVAHTLKRALLMMD